MNTEINSQIEGEFNGFNEGTVFRLINGQVWQQKNYFYMYKYAYRPFVQIVKEGMRWFLNVKIAGCPPVEVVQVNLVYEGRLVSDFKGFFQNAKFQFQNGSVWEQSEYKYNYHYAYNPYAVIVYGINGYELSVDGMSETVRVRRVR